MADKVLQIDISRLSWRDSKALSIVQVEAAAAQAANDAAGLEKAFARLEGVICRVVTYIPRDMLVSDAPGDLKLDQPAEVMDYVRADAMEQIQQAIGDAQKKRTS